MFLKYYLGCKAFVTLALEIKYLLIFILVVVILYWILYEKMYYINLNRMHFYSIIFYICPMFIQTNESLT